MELAWIWPWSLGLRKQTVQHHGQRDVAAGASRAMPILDFNPAPEEVALLPAQAQRCILSAPITLKPQGT